MELSFAMFTYDKSMFIVVVIYNVCLPWFPKSRISLIR